MSIINGRHSRAQSFKSRLHDFLWPRHIVFTLKSYVKRLPRIHTGMHTQLLGWVIMETLCIKVSSGCSSRRISLGIAPVKQWCLVVERSQLLGWDVRVALLVNAEALSVGKPTRVCRNWERWGRELPALVSIVPVLGSRVLLITVRCRTPVVEVASSGWTCNMLVLRFHYDLHRMRNDVSTCLWLSVGTCWSRRPLRSLSLDARQLRKAATRVWCCQSIHIGRRVASRVRELSC